jgi:hypothetical protein
MPSLSLPPSVRDARGLGVEALVERLGALDLSSLLVYSIPTAPVSVMPFLAWQFDVISPFWQLLVPGAAVPAIDGVLQKVVPVAGVTSITDVGALISVDPLIESEAVIAAADQSIAVQRQVLEQALALHGKRGTAWAIKTAIAALGWPSAEILEGQESWGGNAYPASQGALHPHTSHTVGFAAIRPTCRRSAPRVLPPRSRSASGVSLRMLRRRRALATTLSTVKPMHVNSGSTPSVSPRSQGSVASASPRSSSAPSVTSRRVLILSGAASDFA